MDKRIHSLLGLTSLAVIAGGMIVSELLYQTGNKLSGDDRFTIATIFPVETIMSEGIWKFGFMMYIIPGIIGYIAAFTENKCMYEATYAVARVSLVIMSIFILLVGVLLIDVVSASKFTSNHCLDAARISICRFFKKKYPDFYRGTFFKACADFENCIYEKHYKANMILLFAFLVLTWVAELKEFRLASCYACRRMPTPRAAIMPAWLRNLHRVPYLMPRAYGQAGSDVIYQATIKRQLTVIVRAKPVTDNQIDG